MNGRSFFLSSLVAGAVMGLLANLPLLNLINCFLCVWIWVGGFLAVILYRRFQHDGPGLSAGQGAGLGAVSGLIGAFVGLVVFILTGFLSTPLFAGLARLLQVKGDLPFQSGGFASIISTAFFFFILNIFLYPLFGAISALIAASTIGKETQPPAPA